MKEMQISMQHIYIELVWANQKRIQGCLQSNTVGKYVRRSAETPVVDYILACKPCIFVANVRQHFEIGNFVQSGNLRVGTAKAQWKKNYMPKWIIRKISWI